MKFLLISPFTGASGSTIRYLNMATELRRLGHSVVYVDRKALRGKNLFESKSVFHYSCSSTGILALDVFISLLYNVAILIKHADCDVFYALKPAPNNCVVALLAKLLGKKVILDVDDLDYEYLNPGKAKQIYRFFFDFFPRFFPLITYHTCNLKEYLKAHANVAESNLFYLAQGVSYDFLKISPEKYEPRKKSIIYVATLGITSDFMDLIPMLSDLCRQNPDLTVSIVGDGCRKTEFQEMVHALGIQEQICFKGLISHSELPNFLSQHTIGINYMRPSKVNRCRAILKLREYLACGLEVVCNDMGDAQLFQHHIEIVDTIEGMKDKINAILSKPFCCNTAGRRHIEDNFRWDLIIANLLEDKNISTNDALYKYEGHRGS